MKRLSLLVVAFAILCLFVACKEPEPYQAPELTKPYINFVNETGTTLRLQVYVTDKDHPTPSVLKYDKPAMKITLAVTEDCKISGYGVIRTETRIDEAQFIAYPVDVITNISEQFFTLENKVYDVHVTYNPDTNVISFNPVER